MTHAFPSIIERLGWTLIHSLWQFAAVAILLWLVLRLLRNGSPHASYVAGCLAISAMPLLAVLTFALVEPANAVAPKAFALAAQHLDNGGDASAVDENAVPREHSHALAPFGERTVARQNDGSTPWEPDQHDGREVGSAAPTFFPPLLDRLGTALTEWNRAVIRGVTPWLDAVIAGWLAGVVLLSMRPIVGWLTARRMRHSGLADVADDVSEAVCRIARQLGISRLVAVMQSSLVDVPTVLGVLRPLILLPASALTGLPREQLEAVIAHELGHVRRYDDVVNAAQVVLETVFFYHPAVWWVSHQMRVDRESCCDDIAIRVTGDRPGYARMLVWLDERRIHTTMPGVALSSAGGSLRSRVRRILRPQPQHRSPGAAAALIIGSTALLLLLSGVWLSAAADEEGPAQGSNDQLPERLLLPNEVNEILGRIAPEMDEQSLTRLLRKSYPNSKIKLEGWSGASGVTVFQLSPRYTLTVGQYTKPPDHKTRRLHPDAALSVGDAAEKRRLTVSFNDWSQSETPHDAVIPPGRAAEAEQVLLPAAINRILGQIEPDIPERKVEEIVRREFPEAKATPGSWSGQTGYVSFRLSPRFELSVAEYNAPGDFEQRFVHRDLMMNVVDRTRKRAVRFQVKEWDDGGDVQLNHAPAAAGDGGEPGRRSIGENTGTDGAAAAGDSTKAPPGGPALLPDGVNEILGRIAPDMEEQSLIRLLHRFYLDAEKGSEEWSGRSGVTEFRLTPSYSLTLSQYFKAPDGETRRVHPSMSISVNDLEEKRTIKVSYNNWSQSKASKEVDVVRNGETVRDENGDAEQKLIPTAINGILGRIQPDMAEEDVAAIIRDVFPDATVSQGPWSGGTGYVVFKLAQRYDLSIAQYNDPKRFEQRYVHRDLIFVVADGTRKLTVTFSTFSRHHAAKRELATLSGRVLFDGPPPEPEFRDIFAPQTQRDSADGVPPKKIRRVRDESLVVGEDGGLANVFVYLVRKGGEEPRPPSDEPPAAAEIQMQADRIRPRAIALAPSQALAVRNAGEQAENAHFAGRNNAWNVLMSPGQTRRLELQAEPFPMRLRSDVSPWMQAWVLPHENAYAALTGADGRFRIEGIPEGLWEIRFWHERTGYLRSNAAANGRVTRQIAQDGLDLGVIRVAPALFEKPVEAAKAATIDNAGGGIRPAFHHENCAWHATHIVLADGGDRIDGNFRVIESWKGNLTVGQPLSVPELAKYREPVTRQIEAAYGARGDEGRALVTGRRMVLFLVRSDGGDEWLSAMMHFEHRYPIDFSVVWVEDEHAYAVQQPRNPGPNVLVALEGGLAKLKTEVEQLVILQSRLKAASEIEDLAQRAAALREFAISESWHARRDGFAALANCGKAALPVLRAIINDNRFSRYHAAAVTCMGEAAGKDALPELLEIIQGETAFWKETAPELPVGWWNDESLGPDRLETLRARYGRLLAALRAVQKHPHGDAAPVVEELRDFWRSLPQLNDRSGVNEVIEVCDRVLRAIADSDAR